MQRQIITNFESLSEGDLTKYSGQWVAIIEGSVVENNKSFKELHKSVKEKHPGKRALMGKIPELIPTILSID